MATAPRASEALGDKLRAADTMTPELMTEILGVDRRHLLLRGSSAGALRLKQLIDAAAWTDVALTLLELELPFWQIRRIAYDSGEWHCALSRQRELPDWLDQSIEARHPDLALAILTAHVETQRVTAPTKRTSVPASSGRLNYIPFFCDNFA